MGSPSASTLIQCFMQVKGFGLFKQRGVGGRTTTGKKKERLLDLIRELFRCHELVALMHQGLKK